MPTMPAKGLDRFVATLTWKKAVKDAEKAKRGPSLKPPRQVSYLCYLQRGLSLQLVISYGGSKSWRALTYRDGKPHYWKLGNYPQLSVKEARKQAYAYLENPQRIEDAAKVGTFKEVAENWFKRHVEHNKLRTADEIRRQLKAYVYPKWADRKFTDIRRRTVAELLDHIADQHGSAMSNYVLATLSSIMNWYQSRDEDYVSPIVKGMGNGKPKSRDRVLSENEIRRLWQAADESGRYGALLKLLLLTAQRRDKVASMRWDDLSDGVWTIRTEAREKGNPGKLKLPPLALAIIAEQPRLANSPYIFPGSLKGHFRNFADSKAELDERLTDMPPWRLHDLRRTARSLMAEAGVQRDIAERVLGHSVGGVEAVYDRHTYDAEKAKALELVAKKIRDIIQPPPPNVVPLERARP